MQPTIFSPDIDRASYNRVRAVLKEENPGVDFIINQNTLRIEQPLVTGRNSYKFDLYENSGSDRPLEEKLNRNDVFFMTHLALCLTKQDETTTPKQYGNYPLFTHPDPNYFIGANGATTPEWQSLLPIFSGGKLTLKTSPVERLKDFLTLHLMYVPERGYLIAAAPQVNAELPQYGPSMEERGFFRTNPTIIIDGNENNSVELSLGAGDTTNIAGGIDGAGACPYNNECSSALNAWLYCTKCRSESRSLVG